MEEYFRTPYDCISNTVRKKRTQTSRRPKPDASECQDRLSVPSTALSDDTSKLSHRKEMNVNEFISGYSDDPRQNGLQDKNRNGRGGRNGESHISDSVNNLDGSGSENKVKLKLKLGGVTHTLHGNSTSNGTSGSSAKTNQSADAKQPQKKLILQRNGLQGIPWKDFASRGIHLGRGDVVMGLMAKSDKSTSTKQVEKSESVRKSSRAAKRRKLDAGLDDEEDDDEIRYLEKLRTSKVSARYKDEEESGKKNGKLSRVSKIGIAEGKFEENLGSFDSSRSSKDGKKSRSGKVSEDGDYEEVGQSGSDSEAEGDENLHQRKESINALMESKELALTTRQRALQSGKDAPSVSSASLEFPNGLPPAPSKKQKEKLSDVDQQVKKTEAAQRRRIQNEKAARESEAEAIRKILGQDSSRKKREDQKKKRQEEMAQEKAAEALKSASTTVRWNMGPTGTVVTFPAEMGLPSIFETRTRSYPPPRENCAGPSCTNPYKYRDSKSRLPLCSLKCYKAIQEKPQSDSAC